jgi:murein L,D-transpeptidase YafK
VGSGLRPQGRRFVVAAAAVLAAAGLSAGFRLRASGSSPTLPAGDVPLAHACRAAGVRYPPPSPRVVVRKELRLLALYSGETLVKEYRIALGRAPLADKEREGDGRTPVGDFYVCTRLQRSRFRRFLGISYPHPDAARRGLEDARITRAQHDAVLRAHRRGVQPPWDTPLGGAVGIHGGGAASDWTLGCVAVEDAQIDELFAVLPMGTPVRIVLK